jgi:hypothetical protein
MLSKPMDSVLASFISDFWNDQLAEHRREE